MDKISVIIPLFNEEDGVDYLVSELNKFFGTEKPYQTEIIFVNDGSADRTSGAIKKAGHLNYTAKLCGLSRNCGSHVALRAGVSKATGDYICFMYADLQDPLDLVDRLYVKVKEGSDIAWAQRETIHIPFFEKKFSQIYGWLMKKYVSRLYTEKGFDVPMFSRKIALVLNNNIESNSSIFLHILTMGYEQSNIQYTKTARKIGTSKWTLSKKIKLFVDSFVSFSYAPIRFVSVMGISFFILGLIWTIYIISRKIFFNDLANGWPALMSILMVGFGVTNISLGVIAEYLWRTLDASRKRPVFLIDELVDLNHRD